MNNNKTVLIYHVYIVNNWKMITQKLLSNVPHDHIYVNINIDWFCIWKLPFVINWLKRNKKVQEVFVTLNSKKVAEVAGFEKLRSATKEQNYSLLTYMHAKGVTKPKNKNIQDWVELMRYFLIDRMDLCLDAFMQGYKLYGVNLGKYCSSNEPYGPYKFSSFHYSGNFVSINLETLAPQFFNTSIDNDYFGVEGFWGKLCELQEVNCPHSSEVNHYYEPYPKERYR
jgi:hypothetical protein